MDDHDIGTVIFSEALSGFKQRRLILFISTMSRKPISSMSMGYRPMKNSGSCRLALL
jgi:hypothetical protein